MWFRKAAEEFEENRSAEKEKCFSIFNWPEWNQWKAGREVSEGNCSKVKKGL